MIDKKVTVMLIISLVVISFGFYICINCHEISSKKRLLGRVTCINKDKITLNIGNEYNLEVITEDSVIKDNREKDILFEPYGEERTIEINSTIIIEDKGSLIKGDISNIQVGDILSIKYNESNDIVSILVKEKVECRYTLPFSSLLNDVHI